MSTMKSILFYIFLSLSGVLHAQPIWRTIPLPNTFFAGEDLVFINDSTGFGFSGIVSLAKIKNYGKSVIELSSFNNSYLRALEFHDEKTGYVGTLDPLSPLLMSTDSGKTLVNISHKINSNITGICGLDIIGDSTVFGVGIYSGPPYFIKSTNRGQTWTSLNLSAFASGLVDVQFFHPDSGFIVGYGLSGQGGVILFTTDGGLTWINKHSTGIDGEAIWKLQILDRNNLFGSVESYEGNPIRMVKSLDGGNTWQTLIVQNDYSYIQGIGFISPTRGWTGGEEFFETNDGGLTWLKLSGYGFERFVKISDSLAYTSGYGINRYSNFSFGGVGISNLKRSLKTHKIKLRPNPIEKGNDLKINIEIVDKTSAKICIYSSTSGKISEIENKYLQKGEYQYSYNTAGLSKGVYLVTLYTNHGLKSEKFIVE